jgi:CRP-like cAMP-binding protein
MQFATKKTLAIAARLRSTSVFADLTEAESIALARGAHRFTVPATWSLLHQGIPADACYVIDSGTAGVFDGRHLIANLGPGDVFGEMAYLTGGQRFATVTSVTPLTGVRIDYVALDRAARRHPAIGTVLERVAADRLSA